MEQPIVSTVTSDTSEVKLTVAGVHRPPRRRRTALPGPRRRDSERRHDRAEHLARRHDRHLLHRPGERPRHRTGGHRGAVVPTLGAKQVLVDERSAQVSVVGAGMKTHPGVTATMFESLAAEGINIQMISTSPIRISCIVDAAVAERAVQVLHDCLRPFEAA